MEHTSFRIMYALEILDILKSNNGIEYCRFNAIELNGFVKAKRVLTYKDNILYPITLDDEEKENKFMASYIIMTKYNGTILYRITVTKDDDGNNIINHRIHKRLIEQFEYECNGGTFTINNNWDGIELFLSNVRDLEFCSDFNTTFNSDNHCEIWFTIDNSTYDNKCDLHFPIGTKFINDDTIEIEPKTKWEYSYKDGVVIMGEVDLES